MNMMKHDPYDGERNAKRPRKDDSVDPTNPGPSIVVHVRNLNPKATEADLLEALGHFGTISYATCVPTKRMALVEFEDINSAKSCVAYSQSSQIFVAGQPALFNFSTSKMIQRLGLECEKPNVVVILTIYNAQYPITTDIIYQICKTYGEVRRIAIIRKTALQAMVEFDVVDSARRAKAALNGADIYSGCCTIKIEFARPDHVKITRNDQDQCDYTLSGPPGSGDMTSGPRQGILGPAGGHGANGNIQSGGYGTGHGPQNTGYGYGNAMPQSGGYGEYPPQPPQQPQYPGYPPQPQQQQQQPYMGGPPRGGPMGGQPPVGPQGGYNRPSGPQGGPQAPHMGYGGGPAPQMQQQGSGQGQGYEESCVVMVYGIDQEKINCDRLFNLLCLYGNVIRIKFMKSKPDTAMVQMGDPQQVQSAIDNLYNVTLFGQQLALRVSRQPTLHDIRDPFNLPDGTPSFKDYSQSRNNRYLTPEAASRNRVVPPTPCLHWFNAPGNMTEDRLTEILGAHDAPKPKRIIIFPVKSERSSSGIAEFENTEEAVEALVKNSHTPVDSPIGKIPYIVKLAFALSRDSKDQRFQ